MSEYHKQYKDARHAGFSLIDTILYAALLSITLGAVLLAFHNIIEGRYRALARIEVEEEANFIMRKIDWALTGVAFIELPASQATSSILRVYKIGFSENPITITSGDGNATIAYGNGTSTILQSESVFVDTLLFTGLPTSTPGVHVALSLHFRPREQLTIVTASTTIETTIYVRTQ